MGDFMSDEHSGSCLCGKVRFRTKGLLREVVGCHCTQCRKQTGLYVAATNVALEDIAIEGEEAITWYNASSFARRGFCASCGSLLFWQANEAEDISIMAGAFDKPTDLRLAYHIFCADKGDFYEITDGLPQYRQGRPGLTTAGPKD